LLCGLTRVLYKAWVFVHTKLKEKEKKNEKFNKSSEICNPAK
jgi:hypothetical protein